MNTPYGLQHVAVKYSRIRYYIVVFWLEFFNH